MGNQYHVPIALSSVTWWVSAFFVLASTYRVSAGSGFILTAYTEHVPKTLPDGTPGFAAANQLIGKLARLCWDTLG